MFEDYLTWKPFFDIVPLQEADALAASDLHGQRFSRQWGEDEVLSLLGQAGVFGFAAIQSNAFFSRPLAGFVLAREVAGEAEILTIAVSEKLARAGLGWRLMQAALREATERGAETIFLEVDEANAAAIGLYRRLGFADVARRPAYYAAADGTRTAALVMRRDLR
ncbi:N-acetyltransferase [Rhizobium sp. SSA_523]|uniref:GNAT family N-acetyltransferase n=1 Tax=Rhizobium sp. SSA_523 TaxID=2952477 RepID=UPI0020907522|nr:N-acetyltransferase [Rhizobium sp. SSA_523]MCO5732630.1 GNAT family N-acetyltransferase [Rhizobium sp. SSA_523]WKC23738.1 N-acetyltransferase [Rhizobium sp. SSA_523]